MVPKILTKLDSRFWILSVTISIYPVSSNDLAADTDTASKNKVLRTMARTRAMAGETVETSEQSKGEISGEERMRWGLVGELVDPSYLLI